MNKSLGCWCLALRQQMDTILTPEPTPKPAKHQPPVDTGQLALLEA